MQEKKLSTKAIVGIVVGVLAILAVILAVILMNKNKLTAMVMRLIRQEGEVALLDASGQDMVIMDNMKLYSGNALQTGSDGLVDLSLDDTKYLTIEKQSQVVFEKSGKALELKLNSGRLFFNVTEKLADDETMDISTSTMVVGIRGTSGWVDAENSDLYIGDGTVHVKGINPETGDTIEADFTAGQKVHVYLISKDGKTVAFELENYTIEDVPREMLRNIVQYPTLFKRFVDATGFEPKAVIREAIIKEILPGDMVLPEEYEELLEEVIEEMKEPEEEEEEEPEEVEEVETPTTNPTTPRRTTQTTQPEETPPAEEQPPAQQQSTPAATTPEPTKYTITVNQAEGGTANPSTTSAAAGTQITLSATPNTGYELSGWTVVEGGVTISNNAFTMPEGNVTVAPTYARLTAHTISVDYTSNADALVSITSPSGNSDTGNGRATSTAYKNETITLTAEPPTGVKLAQWIVQAGGVVINAATSATTSFVMGDADVSIRAEFESLSYTVTVNYDDTKMALYVDGQQYVSSGTTYNEEQMDDGRVVLSYRLIDAGSGTLSYSVNDPDGCDIRKEEPGTDGGSGTIYITPNGNTEDIVVTFTVQ
ncbi:MAG: FecR domain-containing protein [Lachnospiraceae bacterium]|nr:FecR domain-containing protein [Lachnospiraceae bacterium]